MASSDDRVRLALTTNAPSRAPIRVLRLMEYEYPDLATMEEDQSKWGVPPIGSKNFTQRPHRMIRSTVLSNFGGWMPRIDDPTH